MPPRERSPRSPSPRPAREEVRRSAWIAGIIGLVLATVFGTVRRELSRRRRGFGTDSFGEELRVHRRREQQDFVRKIRDVLRLPTWICAAVVFCGVAQHAFFGPEAGAYEWIQEQSPATAKFLEASLGPVLNGVWLWIVSLSYAWWLLATFVYLYFTEIVVAIMSGGARRWVSKSIKWLRTEEGLELVQSTGSSVGCVICVLVVGAYSHYWQEAGLPISFIRIFLLSSLLLSWRVRVAFPHDTLVDGIEQLRSGVIKFFKRYRYRYIAISISVLILLKNGIWLSK